MPGQFRLEGFELPEVGREAQVLVELAIPPGGGTVALGADLAGLAARESQDLLARRPRPLPEGLGLRLARRLQPPDLSSLHLIGLLLVYPTVCA